MATKNQEKAFCLLESTWTHAVISVLRNFRTQFGKHPPRALLVRITFLIGWGSLGQLLSVFVSRKIRVVHTSEDTVERIEAKYASSPITPTRRASRELDKIPQSSVWSVLRKANETCYDCTVWNWWICWQTSVQRWGYLPPQSGLESKSPQLQNMGIRKPSLRVYRIIYS